MGAIAAVALGALISSPVQAAKPIGSPVEVVINSTASGTLAGAIQYGWWGHEGGANNGTGTGTSFPDLDLNDPAVATTFPDLANVGVAFVETSADGSAEHPAVTGTKSVDQVFPWFMDSGVEGGLNGTTAANDSVKLVSTGAEYDAWFLAGQHSQSFNNNLQLTEVENPENPISPNPQGKSILNRWAAGAHISMVLYRTTGALVNGKPVVYVDGTGHAVTAYMPFTTVAKPGDTSIRTSAGYQVVGAYAPTVALSHSFNVAGTTATLTGTVKTVANTTATGATGTMEFYPVVSNVRAGSPSATAPTSNGVASTQISGFTSGSTKVYDVRYVPDVAAGGTYLTTDYVRRTLIAPVTQTATTTKLTISGVATRIFTATVAPKLAGKVVFKNGTVTMGTVVVSTTTGTAKLAKALTAGKHVITATFTPTNTAAYKSSTVSKTVWQPTITISLSPASGKKGTRPKVTVKVVATGATVSGKIIVTFDPPTGATKKYTIVLKNGAGSVLLPATVKGKTKVSATYGGNTLILPGASKVVTFTAK